MLRGEKGEEREKIKIIETATNGLCISNLTRVSSACPSNSSSQTNPKLSSVVLPLSALPPPSPLFLTNVRIAAPAVTVLDTPLSPLSEAAEPAGSAGPSIEEILGGADKNACELKYEVSYPLSFYLIYPF
jgi:hypothetical protein